MGIQTLPVSSSSNGLMNEERFTSSSTWTAPANINKVWLSMVGGGGGGSGGTANGSGPGQTGQIINQQVTIVAGTAYAYTIGAGGTAGTTNNNGNTGSNTTFLGLTASGGYGGQTGGNNSSYDRGRILANTQGLFDRPANLTGGGVGPANTGTGGMGGNYAATGGVGGSGYIILKWIS
jgi:hypothetical protein